MSRPKIKICGITSLEDARFIAGQQADYLGFIFHEESPRYISPEKAGAVINWIHGPKPVGVFVNRPAAEINDIVTMAGLELVQLHGIESPALCSQISKPVIKVFHIDSQTDASALIEEVELYENVIDYILFDTKQAGLWGGTGKTFNWSLLNDFTSAKPIFLSGGIGVSNIEEACRTVDPYALDISSSIESEPGVKDFDKVEELFNAINHL